MSNQFEHMRVERNHGQSQVLENTEYFRPGEDLDKVIRRGTKKILGQEGYLWNHHQNNRDEISLQMNKHHNYLSWILSLPRVTQRAGDSNQRKYLAFLPWATLSPLLCAKSNQGSLSSFKNIINILSGWAVHITCTWMLPVLLAHTGFGIIPQAKLLAPFSLIKGTF